jgi:outer membrane biogenesis lipoprotein LolB
MGGNTMKKLSIVLLAVLLTVALLVLTGCSSGGTETKRTLNAKVRYFDGTSEMIELQSYLFTGGMVKLITAAGDVIIIGPNNVIILDEEVRQ